MTFSLKITQIIADPVGTAPSTDPYKVGRGVIDAEETAVRSRASVTLLRHLAYRRVPSAAKLGEFGATPPATAVTR